MQHNKLYVVIRGDMPKNYQAVQGGHAVAAFTLEYPTLWSNGTLVYLKVNNEKELADWADKLHENYIITECFFEPDMNNEMTAFACCGCDDLVKDLKLL